MGDRPTDRPADAPAGWIHQTLEGRLSYCTGWWFSDAPADRRDIDWRCTLINRHTGAEVYCRRDGDRIEFIPVWPHFEHGSRRQTISPGMLINPVRDELGDGLIKHRAWTGITQRGEGMDAFRGANDLSRRLLEPVLEVWPYLVAEIARLEECATDIDQDWHQLAFVARREIINPDSTEHRHIDLYGLHVTRPDREGVYVERGYLSWRVAKLVAQTLAAESVK